MFAHMETVPFAHLLWYFLAYAFLGWCIEVAFCSVNTGKFVNRGFLNGPVCPIYGFGGVCLILLLTPLEDNVLLLYIGSVVVCSALECLAGYLLKKIFHTSWWDYSDQPFNLGGYICLKFSLAWGIAGVLLMRVIHPAVAGLVGLLPGLLSGTLLTVLYAALLVDLAVTVVAVRKLDRDLGEMTRIAGGIHKGSEAIAEKLGNTAISVAGKVEELDLEGKKQQLEAQLNEGREKYATKKEEARQHREANAALLKQKLEAAFNSSEWAEKLEQLVSSGGKTRKRLLRAFPNMDNARYQEALDSLREKLSLPGRHGSAGSADANTGDDDTDSGTSEGM